MQEAPACRRGACRCEERVQVGVGGGEGGGSSRRQGNGSSSARCRTKLTDTEAPRAHREMNLEVGGRRVQPLCAVVGSAEERKGSMAKICGVLLEVRAGRSTWDCSGEVLEP
jgi:hypothetical protein